MKLEATIAASVLFVSAGLAGARGFDPLEKGSAGAANVVAGIYVVGVDGRGERRLARSDDPSFSWSSDGSRIALALGRFGSRGADIFIAPVAPGQLQRLLRTPNFTERDPSWSPDGTKIAFTASNERDFTGARIWVASVDGSSRKRLSRDPFELDPTWSPDGSALVFIRHWNTHSVMTMTAAGSVRRRLTQTWGQEACPAWSPNGRQIAFVREVFNARRESVSWAYWVMNADGTGKRLLLPPPRRASADCPSWAPDGRSVALSYGSIWTVKPDGTDRHRLTTGVEPAWSPSGQQVAFVRKVGRQSELYVINIDGTGETRLTRTAAFENHPAWSPDGTKIAFARE